MESRNPAFRGNAFGPRQGWQQAPGYGTGYGAQPGPMQQAYGAPPAQPVPPAVRPMTLDDVVVRGFLTLVTLVVTGALAWVLVPAQAAPAVLMVSVLASLGVWAFITFGRKVNPPLVLAFAALYGVMVGIVSHSYNDFYHGVVFQAVIGTALAFGAMLGVHALRIIRVTPKFTRFVVAAGFALMALFLIEFFVVAFGAEDGIGIRDPGNPLSYLISVAVILVGCFFLLLDFDAIEKGVRQGAPSNFAWYCAFALVLSLIWLYLELLWLLTALAGRD